MKRPRIAIPEINQNIENYIRAARAAGMDPVAISLQEEQAPVSFQQEYMDYSHFQVKEFDGLLLPGGGDVNPCRYGKENQGSIMIVDALDKLQFEVLDAFVKSKKPIFGICRGHQVINVYFGGTLIQHLSTSFRHSRKLMEPDKVHWCIAEKGSWLEKIYGREFAHNSAHHQAVERFGKGLIPDSHCLEDGTVEAMHHEALPIYSLQWHPERMCTTLKRKDTVDGILALQFFCKLCGGNPEMYDETENQIMKDGMGI